MLGRDARMLCQDAMLGCDAAMPGCDAGMRCDAGMLLSFPAIIRTGCRRAAESHTAREACRSYTRSRYTVHSSWRRTAPRIPG